MNRQPTAGVTLDIPRLEEGYNRLSRQITPQALDLEWPEVAFAEVIELDLEVIRMGDNLQIDGRFRGSLQAACDRCLREFDETLAGDFRILGRRGDEQTHELANQDGIVFHEGHTVDLTDEIREAILLEVPLQMVCSETCRGLCPTCGADLNESECNCAGAAVDPRWAALQELRDDRDPD